MEPYDFRKPIRLATDLEQDLVAWFRGGAALVREKWATKLPIPVDANCLGLESSRPADALAALADSAVAYCVGSDTGALRTLLVFPRPLLLTLVGGILGDSCDAPIADRAMTPVEESLCEYLVQHFLAAILEAWPGDEPVSLRMLHVEKLPKRSRLFAPNENLVLCRFAIQGPFGEQPLVWLFPQEGMIRLVSNRERGHGGGEQEQVRPRVESIVREMPLELAVSIGAAELHVSQLVRLRAGDVVILDQPVSSPLKAVVAGETRFHVWAGRVGTKQAVQIESLVAN